MGSFAKYVGGSPTNTAVGLARLGLKSALITRVGADHMGRFITEQLEREGVDTSAVHSDPERLTALVILGIRDREQFPLIFYREDCADMALDAGDIDARLVQSANAILINGTHLSTASVFDASMKAIKIAKEGGGKVVFDVDYRPVLWGLTGSQFLDVLDLTRRMTLGQISAREDFAKRIAAEKPVYLHECLYPLMQGWDSVEIRADVELGGTEQLFSLLVARDLQAEQGQEPQVAMTMPILVGTDGTRRMGKSLGNYIGVAESATAVRMNNSAPPNTVTTAT